MLRRRRIGAAYERCPAEIWGDWARRNTVIIMGGAIAMVLWWGVVIVGVKIMNVISSDGTEMGTQWNDSSPTGIAVKLIGGFVLFLLILKSQAK